MRRAHFNVEFYGAPNREETIHRSKAVGEPPLMLALSGFHALRDAIASVADYAAVAGAVGTRDARAHARRSRRDSRASGDGHRADRDRVDDARSALTR